MNIESLKEIAAETFLSVTLNTEVKLNKKDKEGNKNEIGKVFKTTTQKVVINRSYQAEVNKQLESEGKEANFVAQERNWKETERTNAVIEKNGELYLSCIVLESSKPVYSNEAGEVIEKSVFEAFLPASKPSQVHSVAVRTFKASSIVSFEILEG